MSTKPFTVTREFARELKRISERMSREGGGTPHEVVRREWLEEMATELKRLVKVYARTGRGGEELLEGLVIAELEGLDPKLLTKIRRQIGEIVTKRQAA